MTTQQKSKNGTVSAPTGVGWTYRKVRWMQKIRNRFCGVAIQRDGRIRLSWTWLKCVVSAMIFVGLVGWTHQSLAQTTPIPKTPPTGSPSAATPTPTDVVLQRAIQGIQTYYQEVQTLCADFQQIFKAARLSRPQTEQGEFFYRKPGKLRFLYKKPEVKDFIYNGELRTLWMYHPEDQEVKVHFNMARSQFGVAMQFLWGSGNLQQSFTIRRIQDKSFGQPQDIRLELVPKKTQTILRKLFFAVDAKKYMIRETIYTDPADNQNRFVFSRLRRNAQCPLAESMFRFKRPAGVEQTIVGR